MADVAKHPNVELQKQSPEYVEWLSARDLSAFHRLSSMTLPETRAFMESTEESAGFPLPGISSQELVITVRDGASIDLRLWKADKAQAASNRPIAIVYHGGGS